MLGFALEYSIKTTLWPLFQRGGKANPLGISASLRGNQSWKDPPLQSHSLSHALDPRALPRTSVPPALTGTRRQGIQDVRRIPPGQDYSVAPTQSSWTAWGWFWRRGTNYSSGGSLSGVITTVAFWITGTGCRKNQKPEKEVWPQRCPGMGAQ